MIDLGRSPEVSGPEVREALGRVLVSTPFARSERICSFLRYVVEHTLDSQGKPNLKEFVIAVEIFGRSADYDSKLDPIVRVEARRLRAKLEQYYENEGIRDPVRIALPKGSYVPVWTRAVINLPAPLPDEIVSLTVDDLHGRRFPHKMLAAVSLAAIAAALAYWLGSRPNTPIYVETPLTIYRGSEFNPSFSPDGNQMVYVWDAEKEEDFHIYKEEIGSGRPVRLTEESAKEFDPVWSPDGNNIAFLRTMPGAMESDLMIVPAKGGAPRRILSVAQLSPGLRSVAWLPDGKWLAFSDKEAKGEPARIFLVSPFTYEKKILTTPIGGVDDVQPAFSPEGRRLAYTRDVGQGVSVLMLTDLRADGTPDGQPRELRIPGFETYLCTLPIWTAEGRSLLFSSNRMGETLWKVSADGGEAKLLSSLGQAVSQAALNSHAHRLIYSRNILDTNIWRIDLSHKPPHLSRSVASTRLEHAPEVSPDGARLAFETNRRSGYTEIWVSDTEGRGAVPLTQFEGITGSPAWSPDGRRIAFDSRQEGQPEIYVIGSGGGTAQRITKHSGIDILPAWSQDGKEIYFASNRTGSFQIWRVPSDGGGPPTQITRGGGHVAKAARDGQWMFYTKDNQPLTSLWKARVHGGEETLVCPHVLKRNFTVGLQGIYYAAPDGDKDRPALWFQSFDGQSGRKVVDFEKSWIAGLSVSADDRYLFFGQGDGSGRDLWLVEGFQ